jgi:hypothetical protein
LLAISSMAHAGEPGSTPVPKVVVALVGCWAGHGEVMGKPVTIAITANRIVQDAMLALDAESEAVADPQDRYSAHLIFGGAAKLPGTTADQIMGFWSDSFGGAFAASGHGESRVAGFDVTYQYPEDAFVNRWRLAGDLLTWQIVARGGAGVDKPFASYSLHRSVCRSSAAVR